MRLDLRPRPIFRRLEDNMGVYNSAILTTAGQTLIANALGGGGTVQFTSVQTSSYAYPAGTNIAALTSLQDVQQTVDPFSAQVFNDTMIQVSSRFDNSAVSEAYLIQTLGIFAQLGSEPAVLFAVVQATTPDQMPASSAVSPSAFIFNIQITVQQASSISVTVNPAGTATVQDILNLEQNKSYIVVSETNVPVSERSPNTWYLIVTDSQDFPTSQNIKVSPTMGLQII